MHTHFGCIWIWGDFVFSTYCLFSSLKVFWFLVVSPKTQFRLGIKMQPEKNCTRTHFGCTRIWGDFAFFVSTYCLCPSFKVFWFLMVSPKTKSRLGIKMQPERNCTRTHFGCIRIWGDFAFSNLLLVFFLESLLILNGVSQNEVSFGIWVLFLLLLLYSCAHAGQG